MEPGNYRSRETRDEIDYHRLLFSNRTASVYDYPFFHGCIDDYLPDRIFQDLLKTFPKETLHINYTAKATLESDDARLKGFWSQSPFCKSLLEFFTSREFLDDLQKFIMPAVIRDRGYGDQRHWEYVNDWSKAPTSPDATPIKVTFKFSRLTPGGWLPPHTDNPCKLLSILLYFTGPDWRESYGGGTEIYEPKYAVLKRNWDNVEMPFELMNRWRSFQFVPNRLVFLLKTKNSWHGVSPLASPEGTSRKSLLITLHDGAFEKERIIHRTAHRVVRALMRVKGYRNI